MPLHHRLPLALAGSVVAIAAAVSLVSTASAAGPTSGYGAAVQLHRVGGRVVTVQPRRSGHSVSPESSPSASQSASASQSPAQSPTSAAPTASASGTTSATATTDPVGGFQLYRTYTFTGSAVDGNWGVYNSSYGGNPNARVPGLVTVSGGQLHVTTTGNQGSGLCLCKGDGLPTSPYGRWDIRARAGQDADHGFAILLWPNAENWPAGGEIDIAEFPGTARNKLQTTVHYGSTNRQITGFTNGSFSDWHTYSVVWTPTKIVYLVDDVVVMTVTDQDAIPTDAMHLALQAGVDNGVTNPSNTSTSLDVAWVKVWR